MVMLSIRRVVVENFRGVRRRVDMPFVGVPSGLYFVRGENKAGARLGSNGAGKSTLFAESLIWVLTGRLSRSQRPSSDIENDAGETTSGLVEFALDGRARTVERTRNPNNLTLDGVKVEQHEIDALLPLSEAVLRKSILMDQFSDMFLSMRPEAKSQMFTETLNLDVWLRAADVAAGRAAETERALQRVNADVAANRAAAVEAADQLEECRRGEERFEDDVRVQLRDAAKQLRLAEAAAKNAKAALDDARAELDAVGDADRVRELNEAKTQLARLNRASSEASVRYERSVADAESMRARLRAYQGDGGVCPECGQRVDAKHVQEKRTELRAKLENALQLVKNYDGQKTAVAAEIDRTTRAIDELEKVLQKDTAAQSVVSLATERSLSADREAHRLRGVVDELETRVNPFVASRARLERRVAELDDAHDKLKARADALAAEVEVLKFWVRGFREIRLEQMDGALAELELAANRHAEALGLEGWQMEFATERETKKGTVAHGFQVTLCQPGVRPLAFENYSGGESQRLQLAATFGLAEVLLARAGVSTDFEVIDEPTTHMSPEGVDDLLACLSERARELDRRIFLIDHNSLDRGSFDGVITVTKDAKRGTYISDDGGVLSVPTPARRDRVML